jgi:imidazolonepropionase
MLSTGTTTVEAKSGYGLTVDLELRAPAPPVVPSHPIPRRELFRPPRPTKSPEFTSRRDQWVRVIVEEILRQAAAQRLARFCDVFCDEGAFTVEESRTNFELPAG